MTSTDTRYWRIRIKFEEKNLAREAWDLDQVGIWYGAWTAREFNEAVGEKRVKSKYLTDLPHQVSLGWPLSANNFDTAVRFWNIREFDWVFMYSDNTLHFARVCGNISSDPSHSLNRGGQVFKYRRVKEKKIFRLSSLPDCFRLLASAGRANVHEVHDTRELVRILARSADEKQAICEINNMPLREWLAVLGPNSWESLCLGYLILERGFVPTGLAVGRTLPVFDIVGRNRKGERILAQCKKSPAPVNLDREFEKAALNSPSNEKYFYFAYGGCLGPIPAGVEVFSRVQLEDWLEQSTNGQKYLLMLR
jgi:hypothetical protein